MSIQRQGFMAGLLVVAGACGGGSSERVAALEAEVNVLKQQQSTAETSATASRQNSEKQLAALQDAQKKLEEIVETVGREASSAAAGGKPASAVAPQLDGSELWAVASLAAGTPLEANVKLDGDTYRIGRAWLCEALRSAAASKQVPKATADKKANGVVLRGIRPKSLFEALGIKNNDIVVEVAGKPTSNPVELLAALRSAAAPAKVKILRKGAEVIQQYMLVD